MYQIQYLALTCKTFLIEIVSILLSMKIVVFTGFKYIAYQYGTKYKKLSQGYFQRR